MDLCQTWPADGVLVHVHGEVFARFVFRLHAHGAIAHAVAAMLRQPCFAQSRESTTRVDELVARLAYDPYVPAHGCPAMSMFDDMVGIQLKFTGTRLCIHVAHLTEAAPETS